MDSRLLAWWRKRGDNGARNRDIDDEGYGRAEDVAVALRRKRKRIGLDVPGKEAVVIAEPLVVTDTIGRLLPFHARPPSPSSLLLSCMLSRIYFLLHPLDPFLSRCLQP